MWGTWGGGDFLDEKDTIKNKRKNRDEVWE